jgi:hypothetical protein
MVNIPKCVFISMPQEYMLMLSRRNRKTCECLDKSMWLRCERFME